MWDSGMLCTTPVMNYRVHDHIFAPVRAKLRAWDPLDTAAATYLSGPSQRVTQTARATLGTSWASWACHKEHTRTALTKSPPPELTRGINFSLPATLTCLMLCRTCFSRTFMKEAAPRCQVLWNRVDCWGFPIVSKNTLLEMQLRLLKASSVEIGGGTQCQTQQDFDTCGEHPSRS
jgi:hypothetical protein